MLSQPLRLFFITLLSLFAISAAHFQDPNLHLNQNADVNTDSSDPLPASTRAHWMRRAVAALSDLNDGNPCPSAAFGCVIVNHTSAASLGDEVCIGANAIVKDGNPTLHGTFNSLSSLAKSVG